MKIIDTNRGRDLERKVIESALAVDEAVSPEDKLTAYEEAYKDSVVLLVWYRDTIETLSGLFDEAVKGVRPTALRPDDIPIDM